MSKTKKPIVDVKVIEVNLLPPQYFLHPIVLKALESVLRDDVINCGKPVPPGAKAVRSVFKRENIITKLSRFIRRQS